MFVQRGTTSTTFTFNGSGGTSASITLTYERKGDSVTMVFSASPTATSGTSSNTFTSNTAVDSFARPVTNGQRLSFSMIRNNGAPTADAGVITIGTDGLLVIRRDSIPTAWTNSTSCGVAATSSITYSVV